MRKTRLSDDDALAILDGQIPEGRPDLASVASAVHEMRVASLGSAPRPSAELAARLDLDRVAGISASAGGLPERSLDWVPAPTARRVPTRGRARMIFSWFAGLGLAAKIAIGATTVAFGAVGAGAVGVLPPAVQDGFDEVVSVVTPLPDTSSDDAVTGDDAAVPSDDGATVDDGTTDGTTVGTTEETTVGTTDDTTDGTTDGTDDGTADGSNAPTDHAAAVQEAAHTKTDDPTEHGKLVREAAHSGKSGHHDATEADDETEDESEDVNDDQGGSTSDDESDDSSDDDSDSSDSSDSASGKSGSDSSGKGKSGSDDSGSGKSGSGKSGSGDSGDDDSDEDESSDD